MSYHLLLVMVTLLMECLSVAALNVNQIDVIYYEFGENLGYHVPKQIVGHLENVPSLRCYPISEIGSIASTRNALILSLGNTSLALQHATLQNSWEPDSFRLRLYEGKQNELPALLANGLPLDMHTHKNISFSKDRVHYGAITASYAALEALGFAFLHPLEPYTPPVLSLRATCAEASALVGERGRGCDTEECSTCPLDRIEQPTWPERAFHIHTQHPLELTEVLQGHDIPQFGQHGPRCRVFSDHRAVTRKERRCNYNATAGNVSTHERPAMHSKLAAGKASDAAGAYCERWEDMVRDVDLMFQWAVANRLNKIEWLLLGNYKWGDELGVREKRLRLLTSLGHEYSLLIGADVPLGNVQQHGWNMVNIRQPFDEQASQVRRRVDWVLSVGFDFMTTESGLSEFTHPECALMLDLLNVFAIHVNVTWGREAGVKVHCSTGQVCDDLPDPRTGDPLNFNFLPYYAHKGLGVFPHTIQVYALDDPTAGAYGNKNFSYIEEYLVMEAKAGNRSVIFYPETSYWVNVDVDVPLFLPLYGQRRQHDLRRLRRREMQEDFRMQGQMNFDSGWEWGYWLSDVVTARSSWNPILEPSAPRSPVNVNTNTTSEEDVENENLRAYRQALQPLSRIFSHFQDSRAGERLEELLVDLVRLQARILIRGEVSTDDGTATGHAFARPSSNLKKLSGIAYLMGSDTWVDLPHMLGLPTLQPAKVHLREVDDPHRAEVLVLLQAMHREFGEQYVAFQTLLHDARKDKSARSQYGPDDSLDVLEELVDSVGMLALRAKQVHLLYTSKEPSRVDLAAPNERSAEGFCVQNATSFPVDISAAELQAQARAVIREAEDIVKRREANYKVYWERVAAWRDNPTVYRYGYLWSVHSLYYWWRDQGLAEEASPQAQHSPCYLNRMDPSEIAAGWGKATLQLLRDWYNKYSPFRMGYPLELINCMSSPSDEFQFPRNLF